MKAQSKLLHISFLLMFVTVFVQKSYSQSSVGIGTTNPNSNAVLELVSSGNNQGFLVPRLTTVQRTDTNFTSSLAASDNGLMVFDSDEGRLYFWFNDAWVASNAAFTNGAGIDISGNTITNTGDVNPNDDIIDTSVAAGDVTGTYFNLTVGAIQGNPVATGVPTTNQLLKWDGSTWVFADDIDTDDQNAAAVPVTPAGSLAATDVQSALEEIQLEVDGLAAADASSVGFDNTTSGLVATNVQTAIDEIDATLDGVDQDASDDVTLTATPVGGDVSGDFSSGLIVSTVGGESAANIAGATATVNGAPNLDINSLDDVTTTATPNATGDIAGNYTAGLTVSTVGGATAANIAGATATVNGAPNLDLDATDDLALNTVPNVAGDIIGDFATGLTVSTVGGATAANIAGATATVNGAPNLDLDATDDLALNTVPNVAGDISGDFATGLTVSTVGGATAANIAGATATVNGAPNLDLDATDDLALNTVPNVAGDISGDFATGLNIVADAVDGTKIADGSIGNADLAINSIASNNIVNGQILNEDISGTTAIAATKLESIVMTESENVSLLINDAGYLTSVSSADITDGEITNLDISAVAAIAGTKVDPNFGGQNIQTAGTVTAGSFVGDGTLLTGVPAVIAPGTVTTAELATGAVDSDRILNGTIGVIDMASVGNNLVLTTNGVGNVVWAPQTNFSQDAAGIPYDDASSVLGFSTVQGAIQQLDFILDGADQNPGDDVTIGASPAGGDISGNFSTGLTINANSIASPQIANNAVTDAKLDKVNIPLSGFGLPTADIDFNNNKLVNVGNPINNQDVATKLYVDGAIASTNVLNNGNILVGSVSNVAQPVALSGAATISNTGVLTLQTNIISSSNIIDGSVDAVDITSGGINQVLTTDGAGTVLWAPQSSLPVTIGPGSVNTVELADNSVTSIKIADGEITDSDINATAGIAASKLEPIVMTESENISLLSNDAGYITSVNTAELADNAVTSVKIADGTIDPVDMLSLGNNLVLTTDGAGVVGWVPQNALAATVATDGTLNGNGDGIPLSVVSASANTADAIVSRDGTGSFAAANITVDNLLLSGAGNVDGRDVSTDGTNQDALQTASGILAGGTDIGDLSGSLVTTGATIRQALEELEGAIEGSPNPAAGLTNGFLPYSDGTGVLLDAPLFFDGTDNLGIGTLAPATKLHLFEGTNLPMIQTVAVGGADINQQAGFAIMSQAGNNETYSQPGTKGWLMTARGNSFSDATQQNDLIFSYSEGSGDLNLLKLDHQGFVGINTNDPVSDLQIQNTGHLFMDGVDLVLSSNVHFAASTPTFTENGNAIALGLSPAGGLDLLYAAGGIMGTTAPLTPLFSVNTSGVASVSNELSVVNNIIAGGNVDVGGDLIFADNGANKQIVAPNNTSGADGFDLILNGSDGDTGNDGGNIILRPGSGNSDGVIIPDGDMVFSSGGNRELRVFDEPTGTVKGDDLLITAGSANVGGGQDGGNLDLAPGNGDGAGADGLVRVIGDLSIVHDGATASTINFEGGASGENVVGIKGPNSTGPGYVLTLPDSGPAAGQVLTVLDASGSLDWTTPAGFSLPLTDAASNLGAVFDITNTAVDQTTARFSNLSASNAEPALRVFNQDGNPGSGGSIVLESQDSGPADAVSLDAEKVSGGPLNADFVIKTAQSGILTEAVRISAATGVTIASGNLDVANNVSVTGLLSADGGATVNGNLNMPGGNLGVNTGAPRGNLDINGSVYVKIRNLDSSGAVNPDDFHIHCDGSVGGAFTIGLPASDASQVGRKLEFSSQNLGGNATYFLEPGPSTFLFDGQSVGAPTVSPTGAGNFSYIELILIRENTWLITSRRVAE